MKNRLTRLFSKPVSVDLNGEPVYESEDWDIGEIVGTWWRPNFETFMYPYLPPHIKKPKEKKVCFLVNLPEKSTTN